MLDHGTLIPISYLASFTIPFSAVDLGLMLEPLMATDIHMIGVWTIFKSADVGYEVVKYVVPD